MATSARRWLLTVTLEVERLQRAFSEQAKAGGPERKARHKDFAKVEQNAGVFPPSVRFPTFF